MAKKSKKRLPSRKNLGTKTPSAGNKNIDEALESTGHLMQLHKLQGTLLAKLYKQIEHIGKKWKSQIVDALKNRFEENRKSIIRIGRCGGSAWDG